MILELDSRKSTAGYMPSSIIALESTVTHVVNDDGIKVLCGKPAI